ncbi:ArpU family transcriptional regulator [Bacillus thuringiensis serovar silo]|uniref:ArpU family transcriptional regulator n=1 Tax=Bacillus thuringiensis TaxID=1428 RepID=UPI000A37A09A|nr:ArpU family transcriptional regulator [Bacillus thuringiensis]MED3271490.1 ArpU family transcriptional regulator [Bacillus thuringiensis]OTW55702.1 ArpU family transcriptional regulator [Bacillus thuringiensis serovar silo]OTW63113.1 ArpU family transcriptional regulator [Bacillus thuringiensis serovar toguchini]
MTKQLSFLPKIDRTATQEELEGVLESVRIHRQFGMMRKEMKVTPSYEVREHGPTHTVGKPLEDVAMANIQQSKREEWLERMSERTYRRWKSKAFYKLAFALGLEVYETEETGGNE